MAPGITPVGEDGLLVEFEAEISAEVNTRVRRLAFGLEKETLPGVVEIVPAYRSLMLYYDPFAVTPKELADSVLDCARRAESVELPPPRLFRLPTVYGGEYGPDLAQVAMRASLSEAGAVALFSTLRLPVYCLGFLCCLAYLGDVPPALHLPRLATPRTRVPSGSVGIAGGQAVVLPLDQPSGFHYLGRTFVTLYDPEVEPPTPIRPGDLLEFPAVPEAEALAWKGRTLGDCRC